MGLGMINNLHSDTLLRATAALKRAHERMGFLVEEDVRDLAADGQYRLQACLVRCGGCRFTAPAQDVAHLIAIIEADGRDYVRDVSLPAKGRD